MRKLVGAFAALILASSLAACGDPSGPTTVGPDHHLTVDSTHGLAAMIDAGHYDWTDDDINGANFKVAPEKRDETMVLVSFNRDISSENAVAELRARNLRPANLAECLAFGETISDTRSDEPIICLGQSARVDGVRSVPALWRGVGWGLGLRWWVGDWGSSHRFLAVRN